MAANDIQILQENGSSDYVYRIVGISASGQVLITNASKIPEMRALTISDITSLATTLAAKIASTEKGTASGVATLGSDGKIPTSQLPDSMAGGLQYQGTWNASTNTPTIPAASSSNKGYYFKVATAGTTTVNGVSEWGVGDMILSNGTTWDKIDNTENVVSVAGKTGAVTLTASDVGLGNVNNTAQINASQLSTDGTFASNSDTLVPSQKAAKTYTDAQVATKIGWGTAPASATASGTTGAIAWDNDYVYVCVATNTWKRSPLATWS